jgi:hypothetical protein
MATEQRLPTRERRPSMGAPIVDIVGAVGPAGISRPKHKRTFTGFGAGEIKSVEGMILDRARPSIASSIARFAPSSVFGGHSYAEANRSCSALQPQSQNLNVKHGPRTNLRVSRTRATLRRRLSVMSRQHWLAACSTVMRLLRTRLQAWPSVTA